MQRAIVEQPPGADEADRRAQDDDDPDRDEGVAGAPAERSREAFELRVGRFAELGAAEQVSANRSNFSITKPKAMTAIPVRSQARKVRSLAAWSE